MIRGTVMAIFGFIKSVEGVGGSDEHAIYNALDKSQANIQFAPDGTILGLTRTFSQRWATPSMKSRASTTVCSWTRPMLPVPSIRLSGIPCGRGGGAGQLGAGDRPQHGGLHRTGFADDHTGFVGG